jgi:hypothetical protein
MKYAVFELPGTVPILRSLRSKMGLSPSPSPFCYTLEEIRCFSNRDEQVEE